MAFTLITTACSLKDCKAFPASDIPYALPFPPLEETEIPLKRKGLAQRRNKKLCNKKFCKNAPCIRDNPLIQGAFFLQISLKPSAQRLLYCGAVPACRGPFSGPFCGKFCFISVVCLSPFVSVVCVSSSSQPFVSVPSLLHLFSFLTPKTEIRSRITEPAAIHKKAMFIPCISAPSP